MLSSTKGCPSVVAVQASLQAPPLSQASFLSSLAQLSHLLSACAHTSEWASDLQPLPFEEPLALTLQHQCIEFDCEIDCSFYLDSQYSVQLRVDCNVEAILVDASMSCDSSTHSLS